MKFVIAFAATLAVASAQFAGFTQPPNRYYPRPPVPTLAPIPTLPPRPVAPVPTKVVNRVATSDQAANILRYDNDIFPDGSYTYAVETDNGISASAQGTPRDFGGNPPVVPVVSQGSFGWTSPEGQPIVISYIADENGYQPQGDAIPTPPPIPAAILKALEYISRNPPAPQKK